MSYSILGGGLLVIAATLPFLLAIIFGIVSLVRISRSTGQLRGRGLAITGLTLGLFGFFGGPLILVFLLVPVGLAMNEGDPAVASAGHLVEGRPPAPIASAPRRIDATGPVRLEITIRDFNGDEQDAESLVRQLEAAFAIFEAKIESHPHNRVGLTRLYVEMNPDADPLLVNLPQLEQRAALLEQVRLYLRNLDVETDWLQARFEVEPVTALRSQDYQEEEIAEHPILDENETSGR